MRSKVLAGGEVRFVGRRRCGCRVIRKRCGRCTRGETYPLFVAAVVTGICRAVGVCYSRGYLLLYGDAVAHLGIARRIVDARYPGLAQLGGVWLPLPHLLMLPFIGKMELWQTGLAAAPMSMLSYAAERGGVWRLGRRMMRQRWALVATAFYALNPNLLFLATTAMTETLSSSRCLSGRWWRRWKGSRRCERRRHHTWQRMRMLLAGLLVLGQVFTRYDGWIVGGVVWCCFAWAVWKRGGRTAAVLPMFACLRCGVRRGRCFGSGTTQHFEHDWLDFMRGPYSAKQIERKTAPPGQHYREWHNVAAAALLFYYAHCAGGCGVLGDGLWRDAGGAVWLGGYVEAACSSAEVKARGEVSSCCFGCRCRSMCTRWRMGRCRSLFRSSIRTRTTTRGMGWRCCRR
jgi:hypothetical protein